MSPGRSIALFLLCVVAPPITSAQTRYFPEGVLDKHPESDKFCHEWYSKYLKAMAEPSLFELSKTDRKLHAYRFLYLRSFHHPIAIRLEILRDGEGELSVKELSGAGGYELGTFVRNEKKRIPKKQVEWLLHDVREIGFWKLPSYEEDRNGRDGARWITEGVRNGEYHVVDRWSPEKSPYRRLAETFLFHLADLKLLYTEVY